MESGGRWRTVPLCPQELYLHTELQCCAGGNKMRMMEEEEEEED